MVRLPARWEGQGARDCALRAAMSSARQWRCCQRAAASPLLALRTRRPFAHRDGGYDKRSRPSFSELVREWHSSGAKRYPYAGAVARSGQLLFVKRSCSEIPAYPHPPRKRNENEADSSVDDVGVRGKRRGAARSRSDRFGSGGATGGGEQATDDRRHQHGLSRAALVPFVKS